MFDPFVAVLVFIVLLVLFLMVMFRRADVRSKDKIARHKAFERAAIDSVARGINLGPGFPDFLDPAKFKRAEPKLNLTVQPDIGDHGFFNLPKVSPVEPKHPVGKPVVKTKRKPAAKKARKPAKRHAKKAR